MAVSFDDFYRRAKSTYGNLPDQYIASEYERLSGSKPVLTDPEFKDNPLGDPGFIQETKRTLLSQAYAPLARGMGSGLEMADKYLSQLPGPFKALGLGGVVGQDIEAHGERVAEANRPSANIASQSLLSPERFGQNVIGGLGQVGAAIATRGTSLIPQQIADSERLYQENLEAGMSEDEARNRALAYTPVSLALERLGLSKFLPTRTPGRLLAGLQEGSTEVAQNVARNVAGDEDPLENIGQAIAGEGLPAGIAAFLLGKSGRGLGQVSTDTNAREELRQRLEEQAPQQAPVTDENLRSRLTEETPIGRFLEDMPPAPQRVPPAPLPKGLGGWLDADPGIGQFIDETPNFSVNEGVQGYGPAPVFFSQLERLVDQAQAPKATGEQWAGYLKNKGAKNEELAWTGADEWLKSQTGPVTKEALSDYVRSHKVNVQEVTLSNETPYNYQGNEWQQAINRERAAGNNEEAMRIQRAWNGLDENEGASRPKFDQYQVPGGENYRELLLTLPPSTRRSVYDKTGVLEPYGEAKKHDFKSSHFDQPNVLAHVRFNERTDADGKRVLFIEEIQSDWHQKGRKQGYGDIPLDKHGIVLKPDTVPDAPFKNTWPDLSMKRMLRWAAENGFDRVAWTPGDVQADRYDLSKQLDTIGYLRHEKDGQPVYNIKAGKDNRELISKTAVPEGELEDLVGKEMAKKIIEGHASSTVNIRNSPFADDRPIGQRTNTDEYKVISGLDLKVGGEGMRGFYDKILVDTANKLGKRFGAKVGKSAIVTGPTDKEDSFVDVHSLDITPAMRESVMQGQAVMEPQQEYSARKELSAAQERARNILAPVTKFLLPKEAEKIRAKEAELLVEQFKKLPSAKEFAAVAKAGSAKRGWYRKSAHAIANIFGADGPRFAGLLAATSPQTSVEWNLINALNIWKNWTAAGRPTDPAQIIKIMGDSVQGNKGEESVLGAWQNNTIRALTSENLDNLVLSGPKVNSFMLNLLGHVNEVTNDAWMANFAMVDQMLFGGSLNAAKTDPGKGWGYLAFSARVREASQLLTKMTGEQWTPAEVQETVWSWAKTLYEQSRKQNENAVDFLRKGKLTEELINATPDFGSLFHTGAYDRILRDAGYGKEVDALAAADNAAALADARVAGKAGKTARNPEAKLLERSARRLESLKQQRAEQKVAEPTHAYAQEGQAQGGLDFETRPDTNAEQVATGNAFMGSLIGWRDRMAGASVLADGLTRDFTERGFTPIVGQSARSPGDLATLAQVYRDPRVEILRLFVMKGDRIVAQTGLGQRLPGSVSFGDGLYDQWNAYIRANEGDGYYLLHNHPTGSARPSIPDARMTEVASRSIPYKFHGHVIVDHNQYGVLAKTEPDSNGVRDIAEYVIHEDFGGYDPTQNPRVPNQWLGKAITHPEQLAQVGSAIGANPGEITLITTNGRSLVQSITTFPKEAFSSDNKLGLVKTAARLKRLRAASGSSGYVFAVTENADDLKGLWLKGMFTDVVDLQSGEAKATGWDKGLTLRETRERAQAQDSFLYNLGRSKVTQVAEPIEPYQRDTENRFGGNPPPAQAQQATAPIPSHVDVGGGHYTTAPLSGVSPEVSRIVLDVMNAEEPNIAHQRGGEMPITWDQTDAEARQLLEGEFGKTFNQLVNRIPRSTANAAMLKSFAKIVNAAGKNVQNAVEQYNRTNSAQDLAHLNAAREQLGVALAPFMGYRTEAGRALNILKQVQDDFADATKIFELLGDGNEGAMRDFARKVKDAGSVAEIIKITTASYTPTLMDQIREYWINLGLLSGPWTHAVNLTSTWMYNLVESATELGTSAFSRDVSTRGALARFGGMLAGVQLGIANAGKAFSTEMPQLTQQTQIDSARYKAIPGKAGRLVRIPGRALIAEDEFNKALLYSGELHRLAMDEAIRQNPNNPDAVFGQVLRSYANNREKQAEAKKYAERLTFQTPLGSLGRQALALRDKIPVAGWLLVPFVRTPTNIVKRFAEYTPAAMVMPSVLSDLKEGGRAGALAKGRMLVGTTAMAGVAAMVMQGLMTGAGPDDEKERALWMKTGRKPYSVKVNGEWVKYNRLEPLGMLFGISADMTEMSRAASKSDAKLEKVATLALASFMTNLGDKTFLRGVTDFMQATTDPERYMAQWASGQAATFAVPNVLAQTARMKDPYVRDARSALDTIKARIPGVRESLPSKLDVSGQPIERSLVEPLAATTQIEDPLAEAMLRLDVGKGAPSRTLTVKGRKYELSPEEYEGYKAFVQQARWKVLTPLVSSPQFQRAEEINSLAAGDKLGDVYDKIGSQARDVWLIQHPEIIRKIAAQSVQSSTASQYIQ